MTYLDAIILGVVEGITEFLPISSTGHLILVSHLLGIPDSEFLKSFSIAIQLGAILAVVVLYTRSFLIPQILTRLFVGFLPTAVIGFFLYPYVKGYLLGNEYVVVAALFIGGVILIVFEYLHKESSSETFGVSDITHKQAFLIGLFQSIALIPGVSRSAATIMGGLLLGLRRVAIVEFSFLLAVPTMTAAVVYDIYKSPSVFTTALMPILSTGFIVSFLVAMLSITFLLQFIKKHTFVPFGVYRIILAGVFFLLIL